MRIFLIAIVAVMVLLAVTVVVVGPSNLGVQNFVKFEAAGLEVRMGEAKRGTLREMVAAPGEVEPDMKVDISAEVSARIDSLPVQEGDEVGVGDLVVKLDDRDLSAALQSAEARRDAERFRMESEKARLAGPRARLASAKRQLERQEQLHATGDISTLVLEQAQEAAEDLQAQVDAAQHAISVIESSLEAAEADISRAKEALGRTEIRSPINGVVTALNAEEGELVMVGTMNNAATVILRIADLSKMHLNARVAESDVAQVRAEQLAEIRINAYNDEVFSGAVTRIGLQRMLDNAGAGYFKTEIGLQLEGRRIYSGLAANVDILVAEHEGIVVQSQAVVDRAVEDLPSKVVSGHPLVDPAQSAIGVVFVVRDGKAVCTPVRTGPSSLTETLVLEGLEEGDQIVLGPYKALEKIKHGDAVKPIDEDGVEDSDEDDDGRFQVKIG